MPSTWLFSVMCLLVILQIDVHREVHWSFLWEKEGSFFLSVDNPGELDTLYKAHMQEKHLLYQMV